MQNMCKNLKRRKTVQVVSNHHARTAVHCNVTTMVASNLDICVNQS